jgi:hypothetical protein
MAGLGELQRRLDRFGGATVERCRYSDHGRCAQVYRRRRVSALQGRKALLTMSSRSTVMLCEVDPPEPPDPQQLASLETAIAAAERKAKTAPRCNRCPLEGRPDFGPPLSIAWLQQQRAAHQAEREARVRH